MPAEDRLVPGFYSETDDTLRLNLEEWKGLDKGIVIRMTGYLDGFNVGFFAKRMERVIEKGFLFLAFDLQEIRYISSRGIGTFTSFLKTLRPRGGDIQLLNLRPKVLEVFRILGFLEYFHIGRTLEEAADLFKKESLVPEHPLFPMRSNGPVCGKALILPGAGRGRCPACKCRVAVDRQGRVSREG